MQITTLKNYLANLCFLPAAQICLSFFDDAFDKTAIVKGGDDFEEISEDALDETVKEGDGLKEIFDDAFDKTATVKGGDGFKGSPRILRKKLLKAELSRNFMCPVILVQMVEQNLKLRLGI